MTHDHERYDSGPAKSWRTLAVFAGLAIVAVYVLAMEHRGHLSGLLYYLPYLLLLACPLMHIFHRHRHGKQRDTPYGPNNAAKHERD